MGFYESLGITDITKVGGGSKQILQAGSARELHESQCERA